MIEVQRGPVVVFPDHHEDFDVNLRILTTYEIKIDNEVTRLDVLVSGATEQWVVTLNSSLSELLVPKAGILGGWSIKCSRRDLIEAFRGLADALDKNWEQSADRTETVRERR